MVLTGTVKDLKALAENPNTPAIQVGAATAFMKAIREGDWMIMEKFAERLVGKIPDIINVNSQNKTIVGISSVDKEKLRVALAELENDV